VTFSKILHQYAIWVALLSYLLLIKVTYKQLHQGANDLHLFCTDFSDEGSTEHELGKDLGAAMVTASFDTEIFTDEILGAMDPIPLDDIQMLNNHVPLTDTFTEDNLRFGNI
jgi:hypothetical protein